MDAGRSIRQRRSTRAFLETPVPDDLLRQVVEDAVWAPSWANTQDWSVWAVTGEALARLKSEAERVREEPLPPPEIPMPDRDWPKHVLDRSMFARAGGMKRIANAVGRRIAPRPAPVRRDIVYGAPCVIILAIRESGYAEYAALDTGLFVQTLCLAAEARGLGTCILAQVVRRPETVRGILPGLGEHRLLVGVALGYVDEDAEVNGEPRSRAPIDELVTWVRA